MHPTHMDDMVLWSAFKSGDEKALVIIFNRFTPQMFNYGYKIARDRELVKDAVQDLFLDLWRKRERLGDTDSIKFYLFKSLRRKLTREKGKSDTQIFVSIDEDHPVEFSPSPEAVMISEQTSVDKARRVQSLLDTLGPRQREAMFLRYFEELSCDQIARIMRLRRQAVYNLLHQSLTRMKGKNDSGLTRGEPG